MHRKILIAVFILMAAICATAVFFIVSSNHPVGVLHTLPPSASPEGSLSPHAGGGTQPRWTQPKGIYSLDGMQGTYRDGNIRTYDFVTGYAWRMGWPSFESSKNVYDFSAVDHIVKRLDAAGQKLGFNLLSPSGTEPGYIASGPGVLTWTYTDQNPRHPGYNVPVKKPVPWDAYVQERFRVFTKTLGDHGVSNAAAGGTLTPLRDHPVLGHIVMTFPGIGSIREGPGGAATPEVTALPGYSREKFISAIIADLHAVVDQFPRTPVSIPFWPVTDDTSSPPLWKDILDAVTREFDGVKNPKIGIFQENLSASKDTTTGAITGRPQTKFSGPLQEGKARTFITFQMLQSWMQPFSKPANTANTIPTDAIEYASAAYGTTYVEIYAVDLDNREWWPAFRTWREKLTR